MRKTSVIVALGLLTGCFSVDVAESPVLGERSAGHVYVSNWGWTLFGCVPLVCGNANFDSWCPVTFFKDEIRPDIAYDKLASLAERKDANLEGVHFLGDNCVLFDAWYAPVPWILVYKETNLSANLVRKEGEAR